MKRNRRNRYKILAKALTTRVRNLTLECEALRLKLERRSDLKEIHELRAALSRACAELMGPTAPDHVDEPRDTRMFPWDDPDDPDLPNEYRSIADDQPISDGCLTERDSAGEPVPLTPRRR